MYVGEALWKTVLCYMQMVAGIYKAYISLVMSLNRLTAFKLRHRYEYVR